MYISAKDMFQQPVIKDHTSPHYSRPENFTPRFPHFIDPIAFLSIL